VTRSPAVHFSFADWTPKTPNEAMGRRETLPWWAVLGLAFILKTPSAPHPHYRSDETALGAAEEALTSWTFY
jgi:hypothetical protein